MRGEGIRQLVKDGWSDARVCSLGDKLNSCSIWLKVWGKDLTMRFRKLLSNCRREMELLRDRVDRASVLRYEELRVLFLKLLAQEEDHLLHRAKFWLAEGDANTQFFHAYANARRRVNKISRLCDDVGQWVDSQEELCRVAGDYFRGIFSPSMGNYDLILDTLNVRVIMKDNTKLLVPFTKAEFHVALK